MKLLALPRTDHTGVEILEPNSSCNQRFDLPGGDVLLPIRYRRNLKTREYTTIIARGHDGLYYEPFQEWTFDDRQALGRSNAQQHWVAHSVAMPADRHVAWSEQRSRVPTTALRCLSPAWMKTDCVFSVTPNRS